MDPCRAAADEIIWHAKHYTGRGVMKFYPSGEDLAKDMGVPLQTLIDTHQKHYEAAKKQETNQGGVVACVRQIVAMFCSSSHIIKACLDIL